MARSDISTIDTMRNLFYPRRYASAPGYPRLDVVLPERADGEDGRSAWITFDAVIGFRSIEHISIRHETALSAETYQVCVGRMRLYEGNDKLLQIYTFGGTISVAKRSHSTLCQIASPAPLISLQLLFRHSPPMRLVEEIEGLLAQRQAAWASDPGAYEQRLALADPHMLYCAFLDRLSMKFRGFYPQVEHDFILEFAHFLHTEIQTIQSLGEWPVYLCHLEDLI